MSKKRGLDAIDEVVDREGNHTRRRIAWSAVAARWMEVGGLAAVGAAIVAVFLPLLTQHFPGLAQPWPSLLLPLATIATAERRVDSLSDVGGFGSDRYGPFTGITISYLLVLACRTRLLHF